MFLERVDRTMPQGSDSQNMGKTSIQVSDELADELHRRKDRGQTYEDVIWNLIESEDDE